MEYSFFVVIFLSVLFCLRRRGPERMTSKGLISVIYGGTNSAQRYLPWKPLPAMLLLTATALFILGCNAQQYKKAVDTDQALTQSQFTCVKNSGYTAAFVRTYKPDGEGTFDQNVVSNVKNAMNAGVSTEVYMEPQPNSTKWGFDQADEVHRQLKKNGVNVRRIWLQVKNPQIWSDNQINNCGFINDVLMRNRQNGYSVGLYTNAQDWNTITGNWNQYGSDMVLWYWNVPGSGSSGESPANFNDFQPFASFSSPLVKQYGKNELICQVFLNVNVFTS